MSLLSLRNVTKRYDDAIAVDRLDFDVAEGSRTVIVGPSGCGKTTLLRLIAGFERLTEGTITLGDSMLADADGAIPPHARNIGFVTQDGALFPHLDVAANIGFGLKRHAPNRDTRITELMHAVGLAEALRTRRPHQLSGGQQQRVALARALARRPSLMLLDEPFSALDAGLREGMRAMVRGVLAAGAITTILVTHDQEEALSFADHLGVMRDGKLAQAGPPLELYRHPADPETASFLGEAIILDARLDGGYAECLLGRVPIDASARQGQARIMLRPEQVSVVRVDRANTAMESSTIGRIVASSFRGSSFSLAVEVAPESGLVTTFGISCSSHTAPAVGSLVALAVTERAHVFD